MHATSGSVAIERLGQKKRGLSGERLGLRSQRSDRDNRTAKAERHLAEHQRAGRATQSHNREAALVVGDETGFEFAGSVFKASIQVFVYPMRKFARRRRAQGTHMPVAYEG